MKALRSLVVSCALFAAIGAPAQAAPVSRYRVAEVPEPAPDSGCLVGYGRQFVALDINDFGIVSGQLRCYSKVDTAAGSFENRYRPYVAATYLGAHALTLPAGADQAFAGHIDNLARVYGEVFGANSQGTIWSVGAGPQQAFTPFGCSFSDIDEAMDGNLRGYVVGWAVRTDPDSTPPLDQFCITIGWVIRAPDGTTSYGPLGGAPSSINDLNVAVGQAFRAAIKLSLPNGTPTVLNPGDALHSAVPVGINDRGQVAGFLDYNPNGTPGVLCASSLPVAWEANGKQRSLALLAGDSSARTWSIGSDGTIVGESGDGRYCGDNPDYRQRATIWIGSAAYDLNALVPASAGITLTRAAGVNRLGQVVVVGYRNDETPQSCPDFSQPSPTEFGPADFSLTCRTLHSWVLTPVGH